MLSLLLSTLEMMGLTFVIGFIVAGVIKGIAVWADSLDYHHSHAEELEQFGRMFKIRARIGQALGLIPSRPNRKVQLEDEREEFRKGENGDLENLNPAGYYHGVSHGSSQFDLMDYFYPRDTRLMFLKKQRQMMKKSNTNNKNRNLSPAE